MELHNFLKFVESIDVAQFEGMSFIVDGEHVPFERSN